MPAFIEHLECKALFIYYFINSQSNIRSIYIISAEMSEKAGVRVAQLVPQPMFFLCYIVSVFS